MVLACKVAIARPVLIGKLYMASMPGQSSGIGAIIYGKRARAKQWHQRYYLAVASGQLLQQNCATPLDARSVRHTYSKGDVLLT